MFQKSTQGVYFKKYSVGMFQKKNRGDPGILIYFKKVRREDISKSTPWVYFKKPGRPWHCYGAYGRVAPGELLTCWAPHDVVHGSTRGARVLEFLHWPSTSVCAMGTFRIRSSGPPLVRRTFPRFALPRPRWALGSTFFNRSRRDLLEKVLPSAQRAL
jgi:hypothetical protein